MSTKIQRHIALVYVQHGVAYIDRIADDYGDYVSVEKLIDFAEQFPKDHAVRTTLLEALGETDETSHL